MNWERHFQDEINRYSKMLKQLKSGRASHEVDAAGNLTDTTSELIGHIERVVQELQAALASVTK